MIKTHETSNGNFENPTSANVGNRRSKISPSRRSLAKSTKKPTPISPQHVRPPYGTTVAPAVLAISFPSHPRFKP